MATQSKQVFLIFGDDSFLAELKCAEIIDSIRRSSAAPPLVQTVDCEEAQLGKLSEEISSLSLFGSTITVAKHFSISAGSKMLAELQSLFERPPMPGSFLILLPDRVDKRLRVFKTMLEQAYVYEIERLDHAGLVRWILKRFDELGKVASVQVAEALLELKGEVDTRMVDSEIQKLAAYTGERREVTPADVEAVVGRLPTDRIFELVGKVANKDRTGAMNVLQGLIEGGESPIGMVILLAREVRSLIQVHLYIKERAKRLRPGITYSEFARTVLEDFREWAQEMGISDKDGFFSQKPYAIYMRFVEAAGFELAHLIDLLDRLLEINRLLVSSSVDAKLLVEMLLASMGEE